MNDGFNYLIPLHLKNSMQETQDNFGATSETPSGFKEQQCEQQYNGNQFHCLWAYFSLPLLKVDNMAMDYCSLFAYANQKCQSVLELRCHRSHRMCVENIQRVYFAKTRKALFFPKAKIAIDLSSVPDAYHNAQKLLAARNYCPDIHVKTLRAARINNDDKTISFVTNVTLRKNSSLADVTSIAPAGAPQYDVVETLKAEELVSGSGIVKINTWVLDFRSDPASRSLFFPHFSNSNEALEDQSLYETVQTEFDKNAEVNLGDEILFEKYHYDENPGLNTRTTAADDDDIPSSDSPVSFSGYAETHICNSGTSNKEDGELQNYEESNTNVFSDVEQDETLWPSLPENAELVEENKCQDDKSIVLDDFEEVLQKWNVGAVDADSSGYYSALEQQYPEALPQIVQELEFWIMQDVELLATMNCGWNYEGTLKVKKGSSLKLICLTNSGWALCKNASGRIGYVPIIAIPECYIKGIPASAAYARPVAFVKRNFGRFRHGSAVVIFGNFRKWFFVRDLQYPFICGGIPKSRLR